MTEETNAPKSKAPGVVWLRHLIEQKGPEAEQAMAKALSPDDYKAYRAALPITWITEETITRIFRAAGDILFSDAPSPLRHCSRLLPCRPPRSTATPAPVPRSIRACPRPRKSSATNWAAASHRTST